MDEDFVDVKGQDYAKRALLIAAAGCHNVLMIGPPGTGKTLLAKRLPAILPPLTPAESLETTRIYSAMGRLQPGQPLMAVRPFCTPITLLPLAALRGEKRGRSAFRSPSMTRPFLLSPGRDDRASRRSSFRFSSLGLGLVRRVPGLRGPGDRPQGGPEVIQVRAERRQFDDGVQDRLVQDRFHLGFQLGRHGTETGRE